MLPVRARALLTAVFTCATGIFAALGVGGCGAGATRVGGDQVGIALSEYRLRPAHLVAPAGSLTITVSNLGRLTHNLVISRPEAQTVTLPTATGPVTETTTVAARSPDVAPGTSTTLTVRLGPGRYPITSSVGMDQSLGAQGTLTVTSK
ncbi:cupredoxin domain-containing protein [Conexibacter sp. DBS9H8]|uniref:cupredoxin domain-containing protein n=1 Tax=Conexibacter sp. DBS9H8 TaxID=2937801 RepID=UPI00200D7884|nr:hypothetical protein [Conexibacter sp. DBS9H8]